MIDFHTHSTASDGALLPNQLVAEAMRSGIRKFSITDHDTVAGYLAVRDNVPSSIRLFSGVELSCQWARLGIHVVGLDIDTDAPCLVRHLQRLADARLDRAKRISKKLSKCGIYGSFEGAAAVAGSGQIGRPHFAGWMVDSGYVENESQAFKFFLGRGKLGDISLLWPTLEETVGVITASGGQPVLAHPLQYKITSTRLRALCDDFVEAGGAAIEIVSGRTVAGNKSYLLRLALEKNMRVSVGSDFHRESQYKQRLGIDISGIPEGLGIWEDL